MPPGVKMLKPVLDCGRGLDLDGALVELARRQAPRQRLAAAFPDRLLLALARLRLRIGRTRRARPRRQQEVEQALALPPGSPAAATCSRRSWRTISMAISTRSRTIDSTSRPT